RGHRRSGDRRARAAGGATHDRPAAAGEARPLRPREGPPPRRRGADLMQRLRHDGVVVVGAGLAGLSAALAAAPAKVLLLTGAPLNHGCSSAWAQGGMAAALSADDAPALHAADTVAAGAGLVDAAMARLLAEEGPAAVRALAALGAP